MISTLETTLSSLKDTDIHNHQLVFVFGERHKLNATDYISSVKSSFPNADIISLSTAGHYLKNKVVTEETTINALNFESSHVICHSLNVNDYDGAAYDLGIDLAGKVDFENIKGIGLISDGNLVNGDELIAGMNKVVKNTCPIFGGMAGDGLSFEGTVTGLNTKAAEGNVIIFALYGEKLSIAVSTDNAWKSFGLEYTITKSYKNQLFELDNKNAYGILKDLLQPKSNEEFTRNTLYFPLQLIQKNKEKLVRTPLVVDHENKNITYASDMPEGAKVKIMKAGTTNILNSVTRLGKVMAKRLPNPDMMFLVSCIGRKVVMNKLVHEEYLDLKDQFSENTSMFGFYSYGEFSQSKRNADTCYLHNQTLTVTALKEA